MIGALLAAMVALAPPQAATRDTVRVRGNVADSSGAGIASVALRLAWEGGDATALSDSAGRFELRVPRLRAPALLTAHRLGYAPASLVVNTDSTDRPWAIRLRARPLSLDPVIATDRRIITIEPKRDAGSASSDVLATMANRAGFDPGSLFDLAQFLNPSVIPATSPDGSAGGVSIGGLPPSATGITLDGSTSGGASLPSEALSTVRTFVSTYDVSRGQFTSGLIAARTRSGTDRWEGAVSALGTDPVTGAARAGLGSTTRWDSRRATVSGGGGGPLVQRWLYGYAALDATRRVTSPLSVADADDRTAQLLAIDADSVRRALAIGERVGFGASLAPPLASMQSTGQTGLLRLDSPLTPELTATARVDWSFDHSSPIAPYSLTGAAGDRRLANHGLFAALTSANGAVLNEARIYHRASMSRGTPSLAGPDAAVQVASRLADTTALALLTLGPNGSVFSSSDERSTELSDDLTWVVPVVGKLTTGFIARHESIVQDRPVNPFGSFSFASLQDFDAGRPSVFSRTLIAGAPPHAAADLFGAYVGAQRWIARFGFTAGARIEAARYSGRDSLASALRPLADDAASSVPSSIGISPRIGFRYSPTETFSVYGGSGAFRGNVAAASLASPLADDGGDDTQRLVCVGAAAPHPDWAAYFASPASAPSACADDQSVFASSARSATVFDRRFAAPSTWRSSIGTIFGLGAFNSFAVEATTSLSNTEPIAVDRNFSGATRFTLDGEDGRPVFAPVAAIDPATGGVAPGAARVDQRFGTVRNVISAGRSRTTQIAMRVGGIAPGNGGRLFYSFGYARTVGRVRATSVGAPGGQVVPTAGDPNETSWMDSRFAPRDAFQLTLDERLTPEWSLVIIAAARSGAAFTPLVRGDVNGDGLSDDRAFVFDPLATRDTAVAAAMNVLLRGDGGACLRGQVGALSRAGSCRAPWTRPVRLALTYAPRRFRNLSVQLAAQNVLAGIDRAVHGANRLHGWGEAALVDETLLIANGFDPAARAFRYAVNPNFGAARRDVPFTSPFTLQLRARMTFGGDPARTVAPGGLANTPAASGPRAALEATLRAAVVNTPARVLALYDAHSIVLTTTQLIRLHLAMDSLRTQIDANVMALSVALLPSSEGGSRAALESRRRALLAEARSLIDDGVRAARDILGQARWEDLPIDVQQPSRTIPTGVQLTGRSGQ